MNLKPHSHMLYDYDVIVIGGGPAGLSAAIRTRWVKRYKALPCSTLVIENARLGGQAGWRGSMFTGPSWKIDADETVGRLTRDIAELNIPALNAKVTRIERKADIFEIRCSDGNIYRSLAVIIATGIKLLENERDYLGKGLSITSMGYEAIVDDLRKLLSKPWKPRLVIVGSPKLTNMVPVIRKLNRAGSPLLFVIEGNAEIDLAEDIIQGRVEAYEGEDRINGVVIRSREGIKNIPCGHVLLEFNSYEIHPTSGKGVWDHLFGSLLISVDSDMQTAVPGILAAGDVTKGGYNSFSRAISQGIIAGLSTYRYVFKQKLGFEPPLFAYRPTDFVLHEDHRELPVFPESLRPKILGSAETVLPAIGDGWDWLLKALDGSISMAEIAEDNNVSLGDLREVLTRLVDRKLITFHKA